MCFWAWAQSVRQAVGFRCVRPVHSSRRKFFIRIQFKKATTIAAKSADRNTFRTLCLRARPERLLRWTLVPAANTICRMLMEIRNEPLNHRPFALRTDAWFAHIRLPYRIATNHGNVFLAWTQSVRQVTHRIGRIIPRLATASRAPARANHAFCVNITHHQSALTENSLKVMLAWPMRT